MAASVSLGVRADFNLKEGRLQFVIESEVLFAVDELEVKYGPGESWPSAWHDRTT